MKSIEIRWFLSEPETRKIALEWFKKIGGKLDNPEVRTDFYMPRSLKNSMGLKLRIFKNIPKVEIKEKLETIEMADAKGIGIVEVWNKWRFTLDIKDETSAEISGDKSDWVKMEKSRSMIKYEILPDDKFRIVTEEVESACNVEITDIKIGNKDWWTLGFETFRTDDNYEKSLKSLEIIYKEVMTKELLQILKPESSYSYPALIEIL